MSTLFSNTYDNESILDRTEVKTTIDGSTAPTERISSMLFTRFHRNKFRGDMAETMFKFEISLSRNRLHAETRSFIWCMGQGWKNVDKIFGGEPLADALSEWSAGGGLGFSGNLDLLESQLAELSGVLFDDACKILGKS